MYRAGNEEQLLVAGIRIVFYHVGKGVFGKIAGVRLLPVDHQHGGADFIAVPEDRLVEEGYGANGVPAFRGIEGAGVVAALRLVIGTVIFDKGRNILRRGVRQAAARAGLCTLPVFLCTGRVEGLFGFISGICAVCCIKVAVRTDTAHIIHGGSDGGFHAGVKRCRFHP